MKHIQILILILFPLAIVHAQDNEEYLDYDMEMQKYILHPNSKDSLCINDINRAIKDISNGKIVFTQQVGFLYGHLRYEKELRLLCREEGLIYDIDLISDVIFEDETQGCYGYYMDKIIAEKYGVDFKKNLHKKADSLFLDNCNNMNKLVKYWECDERPRLPNEDKRTDDYLPSIKVENLDIKKDTSQYGGWPFFDLGFIVEKDSSITNFYISNWVPHDKRNEKYKSQLIEIAVKYLKDNYPVWIPGLVSNTPVRTDNNVRIHFEK